MVHPKRRERRQGQSQSELLSECAVLLLQRALQLVDRVKGNQDQHQVRSQGAHAPLSLLVQQSAPHAY